MNTPRPTLRATLAAGTAAAITPRPGRAAESVPRVAMILGDIPLTTGQPSQGQRFIGYTLYDALQDLTPVRAG